MSFLKYRFSPNVSSLFLLGCVLIVAGVWYASYKAGVIGNALAQDSFQQTVLDGQN
jgi:hypothetical protein